MTKPRIIAAATAENDKQPPAPESSPTPSSPKEGGGDEVLSSPMGRLFGLQPGQSENEATIRKVVSDEVWRHLQGAEIERKYNVVFLYDHVSILRPDANRIYSALKGCDSKKPLLLFLNSPGGDVAVAYLVAKVCREHTQATFEVAVPRQAKSAATLICCGADKLHLGSLSELGPIDPQFSGIPALAYKHSVEHIAQLAIQYPGASSMLSEYLSRALPIQALGYFERAATSASQYAIRLLNSRKVSPNDPKRNGEIAEKLVYLYKDHGFVIDAREAADILGEDAVASNTLEYTLASDILESLDLMGWFCRTRLACTISLIGSFSDCMVVSTASSTAS